MKAVVLSLLLASVSLLAAGEKQPARSIGQIESIESIDNRKTESPTTICAVTDEFLYFRIPSYERELKVYWNQVKYPKKDQVMDAIAEYSKKQKLSAITTDPAE